MEITNRFVYIPIVEGGPRPPGNVSIIVSLCFSLVLGLILRTGFVEPHCGYLCYVIIVEGGGPLVTLHLV